MRALDEHIDFLARLDRSDIGAFQSAVAEAVELKTTTVKLLAERFGASLPTVRRWCDGMNAPNDLARGPVYEYLLERALDKAGHRV